LQGTKLLEDHAYYRDILQSGFILHVEWFTHIYDTKGSMGIYK